MTLLEILDKGGFVTFVKKLFLGGYFGSFEKSLTDIAISNSLTDVIEMNVSSAKTFGLQIKETAGVHSLSQFVINARFHSSGSYQTLFSSTGDYTNPAGLLVGTSGDLTILPASGSGWFILDCDGIEFIQIRAASSNVAGSTIDALGSSK